MLEYVINMNVGSPFLDGKYAVVFEFSETSSGRKITFCGIRKGVDSPPFAGCAVKNPKDPSNPLIGMREAYKRAVTAMLNNMGYSGKLFLPAFRRAFWRARNSQLGY